jgi:Ca-activated chloride channel homolog
MRITTPLGLLGLIGLLLLILIYILKPKFQERAISSTFIWKLSLKYKKQKNPFQWLKSSLLVVIQFLLLSLITFALLTPLINLKTQTGEKIIILDASANMLAESNGRSRFERAIQEIGALADSTTPEHRFTVIVAGREASFLARRLDSSKFIKQLLSELSPTYESADINAALSLTEGVLAENPDAEIILFTGNRYSETGTMTIRDMSNNEWNATILDFKSKLKDGYYEFTTKIASFNKNATLTVSLYLDNELKEVKTIDCQNNAILDVTWSGHNILKYSKAEVIIEQNDDFKYDNQFVIFGWDNELFRVQIVSENPRFLQAVMLTLGNFKIDIPVAPDINSPIPIKYEGYDLYIFDSIVPEYIPSDGALWLINPQTIANSLDVTLGARLSGDFSLSGPSEMDDRDRTLLNFVTPSNISLSTYAHLGNYEEYKPLLYVDEDPVVLTRDMDGQIVTIFAFSLHHSNLPIIPEYVLLFRNLSTYSTINMVEKVLFNAGETVHIRKKPMALHMTLESLTQLIEYNNYPVEYIARTPGLYEVTQYLATGDTQSLQFFVRIAENQANFYHDYGTLLDPIRPSVTGDIDIRNDTLDIIMYLVGVMMVLLLIEWGLHYNEHN